MQEYQKKFFKYSIPALMGMLVTTLYTFVDGIFVGNFVGANALASINVVWPFISVCISSATLIAVGGGAMVSINFGRKNEKRAQSLFSQCITVATIFLIIFSLLCIIFPTQISQLLGASDILLEQCAQYMRAFMCFGLFLGLSVVLSIFINNDGNPGLAFLGMLAGCISNIFLDYLLVYVFKMGIAGAAIASGLGQVASFSILMMHFITKKGKLKLKFSKIILPDVIKVLKTGFPVFISDLCFPLGVVATNYVIIRTLGEAGMATFGIIAYIISLFVCVFAGISQGLQPLISFYYGEKRFDMVKKIFKMGISFSIIMGIVVYVLLFIFARPLINVFLNDSTIINATVTPLRLFNLFGFPYSITIIILSLFQSMRFTKVARTISLIKCFVLNFIFIFTLPFIFPNSNVIWLCTPIAEICAMIISIILYKKNISRID